MFKGQNKTGWQIVGHLNELDQLPQSIECIITNLQGIQRGTKSCCRESPQNCIVREGLTRDIKQHTFSGIALSRAKAKDERSVRNPRYL